jgi:hypothetical protein
MFDRALYQSDWFSQGFLRNGFADAESDIGSPARRTWWRFLRIAIRLSISFGLAWMIALFLELAIFSDTITDKIKRENVSANQPLFEKLDRYEAALDSDIARRRQNLAAAEAIYRDKLAEPIPQAAAPQAAADRYEPDLATLDKEERELRGAIREINASIASYSEEMNAEQRGQKLRPTNSGRAGTGPRYEFARQQREVFLEQRAQREKELAQLQSRREELRTAQRQLAAAASSLFNEQRTSSERTLRNLEAQVDTVRRELRELEASRGATLETFRRQTLSSSEFKKLRDDPLARMTAYQELKNDPVDGTTITLFSWMTKLLVIFLEIVPVVAKIFFSPPSVYAARIQAEVACARARIRYEIEQESTEEFDQQKLPARQRPSALEITNLPLASVVKEPPNVVLESVSAEALIVAPKPAPDPNAVTSPRGMDANVSAANRTKAPGAPAKVSVKLAAAAPDAVPNAKETTRMLQPAPSVGTSRVRTRPQMSQRLPSDLTAHDASASANEDQPTQARSLEQDLKRDLEQVVANARSTRGQT